MNYLAIYNQGINKVRNKICEHLNGEYHSLLVRYTRYDYFFGKFQHQIPTTSMSIKEVKKGVISFNFSIQGIQFEEVSNYYKKWKDIFWGLEKGFNSNQYLDIKEKFLEVTDEKGLKDFLSKTHSQSILDSKLGKKLIAIFKQTTMYKNICDDYENLNRNFERFAKNGNHEMELFKLKFIGSGKIKMIYNEIGVEREQLYYSFEEIADSYIVYNIYEDMVMEYIVNECRTFSRHLMQRKGV